MYNIAKPTPDDLPTSKQLLRSTLIALVTAIAILFTVVLPSEYAIDPTGIGRMLGLTEMGEIKTQLAEEAAIDASMDAAAARAAVQPAAPLGTGASSVTAQPAPIPLPAADSWRDEMQVVLTPDKAPRSNSSCKLESGRNSVGLRKAVSSTSTRMAMAAGNPSAMKRGAACLPMKVSSKQPLMAIMAGFGEIGEFRRDRHYSGARPIR